MKRVLAAVLLALLSALAFATDGLVPVPPLNALVTDLTGTLSAGQLAALETRLREFQARKGSQLAVLIVPSTQPEAIEQYAIRVVDQWKLGRRKVDDGVLLLVAKNDRTVRIEVGYGLEGVLPDAVCNRIITQQMTPRFRQGDYDGGVEAATTQLMKLIDGEALPEAPSPRGEGVGLQHIAPILLMIALVVGGVLRRVLGRLPGAAVAGVVVGGFAWLISGTVLVAVMGVLIAFAVTLLSGSGRGFGGYGAWTGGSSGPSSGGGFGGGGGGGFGGGGASGRW